MGSTPTELLWGIVNTVLVLLMQAGFICHEIGLGNSRHTQIIKQIMGLAVSVIFFGLAGYGLMFADESAAAASADLFRVPSGASSPLFLFQLMVCVTAVTVLTSAAANRLSITGHLLLVMLVSSVIYPLLMQWSQGRNGWLVRRGFIDLTGSATIFIGGGAVLLAIVLVIGHSQSHSADHTNHDANSAFGALGILLLTIGWIGFAGGHTVASDMLIGRMTLNVLVAAASGMLVGIVWSWWQSGLPRLADIATAVLVSLISIGAGVHLFSPLASAFAGVIVSLAVFVCARMLQKRHVHSALVAIPAYMLAGILGMMFVALLAPSVTLNLPRGAQLMTQLLAVIVVFVVAFVPVGLLLLLLKWTVPQFVFERTTYALASDGSGDAYQTYTDLMAVLEAQSETGDLSLRAPEEAFSEFGRIAQTYNRVISKLEQTNHQSETIIRSAMDGIVTIRQSDLAILGMNPAAETIFGQQTDNLRETPVSALIDLDSLEDASTILAEALRTGQSFQFSALNFTGARFPVEAVVSDAVLDGEAVYIATFRDITERYHAQAQLEELNERLVEASRHQEAFVAAISHELRTPLNAILGMSQALSANVYGEMASRQRGATEKITESGRHLLELIDDILDLSKLNSDEQVVEKHPLPVSYICNAALSMVQPQANEKKIRIRTKFDPQVVTVEADARRLKQILINLLNNAVKFTPENGRVGLMVVGAHSTNEVHFIVWDNGIGIPANRKKELFQPFVQLDSSPARQYGGVGLGLALVKQLVALHNGKINVISEVDKGSRFVVTLPWPKHLQAADDPRLSTTDLSMESVPFEANVTPRPSKADKGKPTILLADNNEAMLTTLSDYLSRHGYEIVIARDGFDAVEKASSLNPDLVLIDVQIRDVGGLEAIQHMRSENGAVFLPIIALSSSM
ncbi:MAG: ATP-binding protein, partial [Candidatus Promineifilaceae bacterium]